MALISRISRFLPVAIMALAGLATVVNAQPVTCNVEGATLAHPVVANPLSARTAGNTELVGDIVISCTGGKPTDAGLKVPQINLSVVLNTNATSLVTEHNPAHVDFSEALLLVDEPNRGVVNGIPAATPLLNCGNTGAPDNGPLGPGVCEITKPVNPAQTYDGTPCVVAGAAVVKLPYGCGRPNAFQGRPATRPPAAPNRIDFLGVPFDPPGVGTGITRILRITNVRSDAAVLGRGGSHAINASLSVTSPFAMSISPSTVTVATSSDGLTVSAAPGAVHLAEGFASAWKYKNIAFATTNATPMSSLPYPYIVGDTNYPADAAQNVPGILYNTEDGFQWQPSNPPPSTNPPTGYAPGITAAVPANYPLFSAGYGGLNTGIAHDGVSSSGTRIALFFAALGQTVTVPNVVNLYVSPGTPSGVMVLTSTDPDGAGAFAALPGTTTTIHNFGMVVYEVLYSDPSAVEYADVPLTVSGTLHEAAVLSLFAPFYLGANPTFPTPTTAHPAPTAIPRFAIGNPTVILVKAPPPVTTPVPPPPE